MSLERSTLSDSIESDLALPENEFLEVLVDSGVVRVAREMLRVESIGIAEGRIYRRKCLVHV